MSADPAAPFIASPRADNPPPFSLEGSIPPRRVPWTYRVTLGLTAFAMVLLPLAYVALTVAAGYGVWWWAHVGTSVFSGSGGSIWRLIAYLGPLIAGAILVLFMIKPLFARPARSPASLTLDLERQPALRDLIAGICARVGAPMPVQVDLDCQVNASARLRRGVLSLGRRDLALTIGLPLAAGLTGRQLAGVLAHEFGHFAQGAGMAFTYVIRSVNNWFARVVFERDEWDEKLAEGSQLDIRIGIIFWLARGGVGLSRLILRGLMTVGHAIACLQLRQMEFDADYYEMHVGGSEAFVETSRELRRLGHASQAAFNDLGELWSERRLVDDFPAFVAHRRAGLGADALGKIDAAPLEEKTRWFHTHPSDLERTIQARALALPGIFRGDGPAAGLFHDFPGVCRETTEHFYREQLALKFKPEALVSTDTAAQAGDTASAADAARLRLAGHVLNLNRPFIWRAPDFSPMETGGSPAAARDKLAALRAELASLRERAESHDKAFGMLWEEAQNIAQARAFISAGVKIQAGSFGLTSTEPARIAQRETDVSSRLSAKAAEIAPFESALRRWGQAAAAASHDLTVSALLPGDLAARLGETQRALVAFAPWFEALPGWLREQALLAVFTGNEANLGNERAFREAVSLQRSIAAKITADAPGLVAAETRWPFQAAGDPLTVAAKLDLALDGVLGDARLLVLLQTLATLYFRLVGQFIAQGEELERALNACAGDASHPAES